MTRGSQILLLTHIQESRLLNRELKLGVNLFIASALLRNTDLDNNFDDSLVQEPILPPFFTLSYIILC